jgi:hypothetical protein
MPLVLIIIICIVIVIIIVIIISRLGRLKPYVPPKPVITPGTTSTSDMFMKDYKVPVPWVYYKRNKDGTFVLDSKGNKILDPILRNGPLTACQTYTYISQDQYRPGFPLLRELENCVTTADTSGSICVSQPLSVSQTCIDVDQISAQQVIHDCNGVSGPILKASGKCLGVDGTQYSKDQSETYWVDCLGDGAGFVPVAKQCPGNIGLVTLGGTFGITGLPGTPPPFFSTAKCVAVTSYNEIDKTSTVELKTCDLREQDNHGYPTQLFRIELARFEKGKYIPDDKAGTFARFTHRESGGWLSPEIGSFRFIDDPIIGHPMLGNPLKIYVPPFLMPTELVTIVNNVPVITTVTPLPPLSGKNNGYWWFLAPASSDPTQQYNSFQYFAFIPDPTQIGPLAYDGAFTYLFSLYPSISSSSNAVTALYDTLSHLSDDFRTTLNRNPNPIDPSAQTTRAFGLFETGVNSISADILTYTYEPPIATSILDPALRSQIKTLQSLINLVQDISIMFQVITSGYSHNTGEYNLKVSFDSGRVKTLSDISQLSSLIGTIPHSTDIILDLTILKTEATDLFNYISSVDMHGGGWIKRTYIKFIDIAGTMFDILTKINTLISGLVTSTSSDTILALTQFKIGVYKSLVYIMYLLYNLLFTSGVHVDNPSTITTMVTKINDVSAAFDAVLSVRSAILNKKTNPQLIWSMFRSSKLFIMHNNNGIPTIDNFKIYDSTLPVSKYTLPANSTEVNARIDQANYLDYPIIELMITNPLLSQFPSS